MPQLDLTNDQLLTTTRSVRKRLDFSRPVEKEVIEECLEIALQAPTGGNRQQWQFVVVTDPARRQALGDIYRRGYTIYRASTTPRPGHEVQLSPTMQRVVDSSEYLAAHMHEVPVLLIPCIRGRMEGKGIFEQAGLWGSILPATWSFMLAARARGLGTTWTTIHLYFEEEAAQVLGIPFQKYTQVAMIPVAYTLGTDFSPAPRTPLEGVVHWDQW